ncbi:MAG TPA: transposase [Vicinamibacterales bacterium]|nr:transposase [Vicinamibacterales bacterium]
MPEYPRHLATFNYVGTYAYFLTFCTFERNRLFLTAESVAVVHAPVLRVCTAQAFHIDAYCYMPDHLHLVITAMRSDSNLKEFITRAKQTAGFHFKKTTQQTLWQRYGYERVLRNEEEKIAFIRYVIENPVRAELVESPLDYPFWGSSTSSREELLDYLRIVLIDNRRAG